jgi:cytochrome c peroxidase
MWPRRPPFLCRLVAVLLLLVAGCEPARQYPVATTKSSAQPTEEATKPRLDPKWVWLEPASSLDVPIRFVPSSNLDQWKSLRQFWTHEWGGIGGQRTAHLGLSPLGAVVALRLSAEHEVIKIQVPLGLPDPTPHIPAVNPPTHGAWRLGKKLFFDRELLQGPEGSRTHACADCHRPAEGFTEHRPLARYGFMNVSSLINCVYNRHQFWDGRAGTLEDAVQRTLQDDAAPAVVSKPVQSPEARHAWTGVIARLKGSALYRQEFARVFGTGPTLDNAAKALATYLRTILSGNSVHDRAEAERARRKGQALEAADFRAALDDKTLLALAGPSLTGQQAASALLRGHTLLYGKARCAVCHPGPLFTDHDFHNVGIRESNSQANRHPGLERGRFAQLPAGLKDRRYLGAFKTPTLRALPRTGPYMHDGSLDLLTRVLGYFNGSLNPFDHPFVDPEFLSGSSAWSPQLTAEELRDLLLFLKALDGDPVPTVVAQP